MTRGRGPRVLAVLPYAAVGLGLYALESVWAAMLFYHIGAVLVLARRTDWSKLRRGWTTEVGVPVVLGCALAGPALLLLFPFAAAPGAGLAERLADLGIPAGGVLPMATYYCLVNPWVEEVFWRGRLGSRRASLAWSDLAFAGYHAPVLMKFITPAWSVATVVALVGVAWLWRRLAVGSGGLAVPVVAHTAANLSIMWATVLLVG